MNDEIVLTVTLQPKQKEALLLSEEVPVLFYGGAKGGGKSHLVRGREVIRRLKYPNSKGLIVRKTYPELLANHIRPLFREYPIIRTWYNKSEKTIYWPNGSTTEFSYLKNTDDVYTYQGREYEDITIDEITQHEEEVFKILRTSLRTTNPNIRPSMLLTGNPGGIGHGWVKRLFIDKAFREGEDPDEFGFVQAFIHDNKALLDADPAYIKRLKDLPDALRRAYLEGDWDVFQGQVFTEFRRSLHVIKPLVPNAERYPHYITGDWGYSGNPNHDFAFAFYAFAVMPQHYIHPETHEVYDFNRIITYKAWEWRGKSPDESAELIYNTAPVKKLKGGYADPAIFNTQTDGSVSIATLMTKKWNELNKGHWITLKPGSKNRVGRVAIIHNWLSIAPDGLPYWLITENCEGLITTLPQLIYDETNPEDVDTTGPDHGYDASGYGLSQIKFIAAHLGGINPDKTIKKKVLPAFMTNLDLTEFENAKTTSNDWKTKMV